MVKNNFERIETYAFDGKLWEIKGEIVKVKKDGNSNGNGKHINELLGLYNEIAGLLYVFKLAKNGSGNTQNLSFIAQIASDGILAGNTARIAANEILEIIRKKSLENGGMKEILELEKKYKAALKEELGKRKELLIKAVGQTKVEKTKS